MADNSQSAKELGKKLKEISVAEFFEKNRHLLGYDNPTKALLTVVKETVDNSIDACEEAGILPDVKVSIKQTGDNRFRLKVEDNGPGIVEEKLSLAFGKFLYGSKFHRLRQARGTQGIGVAGAILYSQLTTGKPIKITSSIGKDITELVLMLDVIKNEPHIISSEKIKNPKKWHGIKIEMELEARYIEKGQSVPEYLKETAIMNPYAKIVYNGPSGKITFSRATQKLPKMPREIKPHPHGVELGILRRMAKLSKERDIKKFLKKEFSRIGHTSAEQIFKLAKIDSKKKPSNLTHEDIVRLHNAMQKIKLIAPPTDCLSQIGEEMIKKGMEKEIDAEFFVAISRSPTVYRGRPFAVEVGIAYGGKLNPNSKAELFRFANKVVHFASVWVPYTSEGKQAIASYPEIIKEIKLALQDAGRKLKVFISRKRKKHELERRKNLFEKYIPEVAIALSKITDTPEAKIRKGLENILKGGNNNGKDAEAEGREEKA
jgi:DNA topoisomerase-6 subunit B